MLPSKTGLSVKFVGAPHAGNGDNFNSEMFPRINVWWLKLYIQVIYSFK